MFGFLKSSLKREILELSIEILDSKSIDQYDAESLGIKNADQVILEYLNQREYGLAIEHLIYIVRECNIDLKPNLKKRINQVLEKMDFKSIDL